MEILGVILPVWAIWMATAIAFCAFALWWIFHCSKGDVNPRRDEWQPDVDRRKAAAPHYHHSGSWVR